MGLIVPSSAMAASSSSRARDSAAKAMCMRFPVRREVMGAWSIVVNRGLPWA